MKRDYSHSPQILSSGWGKIEVETIGSFKDVKLWPGGGRSWDWSETGTGHGAGIQLEDVRELIEKQCRIIVLTTGRLGRLRVPKQLVQTLEQAGSVEVIVATTKKGIRIYNDYSQKGERVGGLFHSTC